MIILLLIFRWYSLTESPRGSVVDCVLTDNFTASYEAASYLIGLGHRDVGLIQWTDGLDYIL